MSGETMKAAITVVSTITTVVGTVTSAAVGAIGLANVVGIAAGFTVIGLGTALVCKLS
jgi:hypothetical protein